MTEAAVEPVTIVETPIHLDFSYTPGVASSRFRRSLEKGEIVDVADTGVVTTWAWNDRPLAGQPLSKPFAWALVQLDGADTSLLHALDAPADQISTGMRVRIRWAEETTGMIHDIACFEAAS